MADTPDLPGGGLPESDLPEGSIERDRWLDRLLDDLLDLPSAERREALEERCRGDAGLALDALSLLESAERAEASTSEGLQPIARLDFVSSPPPETLGVYRVLREIGRGGMGIVYLGERQDGAYEQQVAIKVLDTVARSGSRERFLSERQILAELDHPSIARIVDGGYTDDGRPYFVMEYVEGRPIDVYAREEDLSLPARLELLRELCMAVDAAHRSLVVHRDIKPSNVLVEGDGRLRLLDFGIAKTLDAADETLTNQRAMTPQYATPEQYQGRAATVSSDVYQLGLVAYELIARTRPYEVSSSTLAESLRLVCEETPPAPSAAAAPTAGPIPRDLDLIVLKALHKEPSRRYATAAHLAEDLDRFLRSEPVSARPDSWVYRARLFCLRNFAATAAVSFALLALIGTSAWFLSSLADERRATAKQAEVAAAQRDRAEQTLAFLIESLATTDPLHSPNPEMTVREMLDRTAADLEEQEALDARDRARLLGIVAKLEYRLGLRERARERAERAIGLHESLEKPVVDEQLDAQITLAKITKSQDPREAVELLEAAAVLTEADVRPDVLVEYYYQLAAAYGTLGDFPRMETLTEVGIETALRFDQPTGVLRTSLGESLFFQGRIDEALEQLETGLEERIELQGSDHPALYEAHGVLGNALTEAMRYEEAVWHQRRALELIESRVAPGDLKLLSVMTNLAIALQYDGQLVEAEELARRSLAMSRSLGGPSQAGALTTVANVVNSRSPGSREAEALHREARAVWATIAADHWQVATADYNLGEVLVQQGRWGDAEQALGRSLELFRRKLGERHPTVAYPLVLLAEVARERGEVDRSRELLDEALAIRLEGLGEQATLTEEVVRALAELDASDA